jgi:signal transduction histidine kinase
MDAGRQIRVIAEAPPGEREAGSRNLQPIGGFIPVSATRLSDGIRLAAATEETQRLERALAVARAGLGGLLVLVEAAVALLFAHGDWTPAWLSGVYAAQGLAIWAWLRHHDSTPTLRRLFHASDVVWASVLLLFRDEVLMLAAVLAIYAAAARWTRVEAIATAASVSGLLLAGDLALAAIPVGPGAFDGRAYFLRMSALFLLAFPFSHVTRRAKELEAETTNAKAMDRALVARELHDGAIQSLIGLEVQVDVLRRGASDSPTMAEELGRVQQMLRQEVLNLRELMRQMKPLDLDPRQLPDFLAESVDKFRRETGIAASFVSELREIALPPRICTELARIAQEALVNVRRHSGAANVVLRLSLENGAGRLVVDDDGRGFDFSGRMSQTELDAARKGPVIIKERVRSIGGQIAIESTPGRGARLEISFPNQPHE